MQFNNVSYISRSMALIRYVIIRIFRTRRVKIKKLSYIGKKIKLFTPGRGRIIVNGKIRIIDNVELQSSGELIFGDGCGINSFSRVIAFNRIEIGNYVSIAQFVSILDHDHNFNMRNGMIDLKELTTSPIKIGNNVWLGDKVTITKGVTIGDNVVIGANSVVTKDIPPNSIAAGVPARVIKEIE